MQKSKKFIPEISLDEQSGKIIFSLKIMGMISRRIKSVSLSGSFTAWNPKLALELKPSESKNIYSVTLDESYVRKPGNSGLPEYKYLVTCRKLFSKNFVRKEVCSTERYGKAFCNNFILNLTKEDEEHLQSVLKDKKLLCLKKPEDFDLTTKKGIQEISNVRLVPGTERLYRGYHPYKISHPEYETEKIRISLVKKQLEENQIQSIITLSGQEETLVGEEMVSVWHEKIRSNGNQFYVNTDYSIVYYQSDGKEFAELIASIVRFINKHPGPYYVHCRLGTDRTGTVCAMLAALCGAGWEQIAADYEKTNCMGIYEYRNRRLLQYCFENMLGHPMQNITDLQKETASHFINAGGLTESDIKTLQKKLCS